MINSPYLLPVIVAGALYAFGQYISSEPIRNQDQVLTVQATGKASSVPDIAHVTLGVQVQPQPTAAQATDILAKQANAVIAVIKKLGIEEKDIKTQNISVQPSYNYEEGKQTLIGFEGNEQIEVTIRKSDKVSKPGDLAGEVIARATQAGANQIGGVTFSNEEPQLEQLAAEKDAIANARKKAEILSDALNVRLGKVKNYNVSPNYGGPMPHALEAKATGGDSVTPPEVLPGTQENSVTVTITYEIR
ncbi:MAG: SIMPL domain-containing protein [bacterium]|nr:SIMPL domain-containing protein [bacterium]